MSCRIVGALSLVTLLALGSAQLRISTDSAIAAQSHHHLARNRFHQRNPRRRSGSAHTSVIGGKVAEPGTFPWLAYVRDVRGEIVGECTGTVVSPNLVLTAGHCAEDPETGEVREPSGYRIITGNVDWALSEREVSGVSRVIVYPNYETSGALEGWGDAALLELSTPTKMPAIRLASSEIWEPGTEAIIAGWGRTYYGQETATEQLNWATTVVQGKQWCQENAPEFHPLGQICTIDAPSYESGTCEGDSGGPLLALQPGTKELVEIGITSYGFDECSTTKPHVDTRSDLVASWVNARIRELPPPQPPVPTPPPAPSQPQLPTMTSAHARSYARQALILAMRARFEHPYKYRATCQILEAAEQQCRVGWSDGPNDYYGSVTVYYSLEGGREVWNDRYAIHWVNDHCYFHTRYRKRCPIGTRRGSALDAGG